MWRWRKNTACTCLEPWHFYLRYPSPWTLFTHSVIALNYKFDNLKLITAWLMHPWVTNRGRVFTYSAAHSATQQCIKPQLQLYHLMISRPRYGVWLQNLKNTPKNLVAAQKWRLVKPWSWNVPLCISSSSCLMSIFSETLGFEYLSVAIMKEYQLDWLYLMFVFFSAWLYLMWKIYSWLLKCLQRSTHLFIPARVTFGFFSPSPIWPWNGEGACAFSDHHLCCFHSRTGCPYSLSCSSYFWLLSPFPDMALEWRCLADSGPCYAFISISKPTQIFGFAIQLNFYKEFWKVFSHLCKIWRPSDLLYSTSDHFHFKMRGKVFLNF